jgi:ATP-dependent Clp protease ATP-binding subunit ClpB
VDNVDDKLVFNHQPLIPKPKEEPLIMNVQPLRKNTSDPLEMDVKPVILNTSKTAEGDDIITVETVKDE